MLFVGALILFQKPKGTREKGVDPFRVRENSIEFACDRLEGAFVWPTVKRTLARDVIKARGSKAFFEDEGDSRHSKEEGCLPGPPLGNSKGKKDAHSLHKYNRRASRGKRVNSHSILLYQKNLVKTPLQSLMSWFDPLRIWHSRSSMRICWHIESQVNQTALEKKEETEGSIALNFWKHAKTKTSLFFQFNTPGLLMGYGMDRFARFVPCSKTSDASQVARLWFVMRFSSYMDDLGL